MPRLPHIFILNEWFPVIYSNKVKFKFILKLWNLKLKFESNLIKIASVDLDPLRNTYIYIYIYICIHSLIAFNIFGY